jgi:pyridinium-3,5-biscarboxylic acid mononucleotide synthase
MTMHKLKEILEGYKKGDLDQEATLRLLSKLPYEDLEFARIDHHRSLRRGFPEVIYGATKSAPQIVDIIRAMRAWDAEVLVTRVDECKAAAITAEIPEAGYHPLARALVLSGKAPQPLGNGTIQVICAGSSDVPVAEEAALTAELMGNRVERFYDVGVAGLHRLLGIWEDLQRGSVYVVVAGMEGALPSVVSGLVARPVIAVPTSIGYGASFGGLAALLGMLNSCSPGIAVVNIDNGFGAGYMAGMINQCSEHRSSTAAPP